MPSLPSCTGFRDVLMWCFPGAQQIPFASALQSPRGIGRREMRRDVTGKSGLPLLPEPEPVASEAWPERDTIKLSDLIVRGENETCSCVSET
jgi:hypothetical protein